MRKISTFLLLFIFIFPSFAQKRVLEPIPVNPPKLPKIKSSRVTQEIVEYAGSGVNKVFVPPPAVFFEKQEQQRTTANDLFNVTYNGFTAEAKASFQYALDIWASLLTSDVPITVEAHWVALDESVLGSALPGGAFSRIFDSRNYFSWHPAPLAEKILGENLNDTEPDIIANFNSNSQVNWYYGLDGQTPVDQFDLVTVILHEIGHGLGFLDFTNVQSDIGTFYFDDLPWIYTTFLENGAGENLVLNFQDDTPELANELQSDDLFFNEKISNFYNFNKRVRIYAPDPYDPGSSISHLDPSVGAKPNGLMRPAIGRGFGIHDPGVALNMLEDMGWKLTVIHHDGTPNTEDVNNPHTVKASITSDTDVDSSSFLLVYSTELQDIPFTSPELIDTVKFVSKSNGNFEATVPAFNGVPTLYSYYMVIKDEFGRVFTSPPLPPDNFYQFGASPDDVPPALSHNPIFSVEQGTDSLPVAATAADFIGIQSVVVDYLIDGTPQTPFEMALDSTTLNIFRGAFSLSPDLPIGTVISYKITATDKAVLQNQSFFPETGFQEFTVIAPVPPVKVYNNDFNDPSEDFQGDLFTIASVAGFSSPALHSPHPYSEGPSNGAKDYISELKVPIILDNDSAFIQFKEVVLVEPGDPGTVFGESRFWDYVIVEGSKDKGLTWIPFLNGYDCRAKSIWQDEYESSFIDFDSQGTGSGSLYRERKIDMLQNGNFAAGETIRIRFRLWSDELAVGWGWAIDNLRIQSLITGIEKVLSEESIVIYPNPSSGNFTLRAQLKEPLKQSRIQVLNLLGRSVYVRAIDSNTTQLNETIDLSNLPDGLYIINLETPHGRITRKVMKTY